MKKIKLLNPEKPKPRVRLKDILGASSMRLTEDQYLGLLKASKYLIDNIESYAKNIGEPAQSELLKQSAVLRQFTVAMLQLYSVNVDIAEVDEEIRRTIDNKKNGKR